MPETQGVLTVPRALRQAVDVVLKTEIARAADISEIVVSASVSVPTGDAVKEFEELGALLVVHATPEAGDRL